MAKRFAVVALRQAIMVVVSIVSLYPLVFIVMTSLKTSSQYILHPMGIPTALTFRNYVLLVTNDPFFRWMENSTILTFVSVGAATVVAALAAYAIAWGDFRAREAILKLNIALMVVPYVVLIIPMFIFMVNIGLINTLASAILFYSGLLVPFSIYLLTSFFKQVPGEIVEAAKMDGTSSWGIFWRFVVPLSLPAFVTLVIVNVLWVWNELLIALVFLQSNGQKTLMTGLSLLQGRYVTNEPIVMAGAFLAIVPTVLLYIGGQRYFIRGLTGGIGK